MGGERWLLRKGLIFCIKSIDLKEVLIDLIVGGSRIHQNEDLY